MHHTISYNRPYRRLTLLATVAIILCINSSGICREQKPVLKSEYNASEQQEAAKELVKRITGNHARDFKVVVTPEQKDGKDWFAFDTTDDGRIVLEGNNGVSVASALHTYLKQYCEFHLSWCGNHTELPAKLPRPARRVERTSPYVYRYYLNYCTFNYSISWWDETRWQQEIDFMALNGINMPLALTGQNTVWQKVYRRLGFTDKELEGFFSGPAFFNWFWMGNLDGWGGPLPQSFIDRHEALQKFILARERSLGMTPVLPAFTGHVPPSFEKKFPAIRVSKTEWIDYPAVTLLNPSEEMFGTIAKLFLEEQIATYGTNHFYTADTFNENLPPTSDAEYLSTMSKVVYDGMTAVDPQAVWLMQAWLFYHQADFWSEEKIEALLKPIPDDRMLLLDLFADYNPVWERARAFFGKNWIWCMLQNFGQRQCLCGTSDTVAEEPHRLLHDPSAGNMKGIGLTMEGINQNPFIFALMLENVWQDAPVDREAFLRKYLTNRYGLRNASAKTADRIGKAWRSLLNSVYSNHTNPDGGRQSVLTLRPVFEPDTSKLTCPRNFFARDSLLQAWDSMMLCAEELAPSDGFRYDLVDVTRQAMAELLDSLHYEVQKAYHARDIARFERRSAGVLELIGEIDALLSTRREFLLGPWVESARALGTDAGEKALYEWNAKTQITLWGKPGSPLNDYASKHWAGLVGDFYRERFSMFYAGQLASLRSGNPFDAEAFKPRCLAFEQHWAEGSKHYATEPTHDETAVCRRLYDKYRNDFK